MFDYCYFCIFTEKLTSLCSNLKSRSQTDISVVEIKVGHSDLYSLVQGFCLIF